jgi:hypothetical protein
VSSEDQFLMSLDTHGEIWSQQVKEPNQSSHPATPEHEQGNKGATPWRP